MPPTSAPFAGDVIEPVGAVASTSHVNVTSEASVFPAASVARAFSVCEPSPSDGVVNGVAQGVQPPPSRSHSKVDGDSVEPRPKVGVEFALGLRRRREERRVRGGQVDRPGVRRRRRVEVAGGVLGAHLERVRRLGEAACTTAGLEQSANAPPSSRHSKPGPASDAVNEKLALVEFEAAGGEEVIVVFAGVVSTVKVNEAGRRVDVAGGVGRAHVERVGALRERAERERARRGRPRAAVEAHLERRARLGRAEREGRRRVLRRGGGRASRSSCRARPCRSGPSAPARRCRCRSGRTRGT